MSDCSSHPLCSFLDDMCTLPPASPRGGGRSKQILTLPIGPEPDILPCSFSADVSLTDVNIPAASTKGIHSLLSEDRRRIWVHGPRPEYKKTSQRYNLPSRMTGLLRPHLDIIILPGGHDPTTEFWEFNREALRLDEWQVLMSSIVFFFRDV